MTDVRGTTSGPYVSFGAAGLAKVSLDAVRFEGIRAVKGCPR